MKVGIFEAINIQDHAKTIHALELAISEHEVIMVKPMTNLIEGLERLHQLVYDQQPVTDVFEKLQSNLFESYPDLKPESLAAINDLFVEVEWTIEDTEINTAEYSLAQLIPIASIITSRVLFDLMEDRVSGIGFLDIRDIVKTDDVLGEASILNELSTKNWRRYLDNNTSNIIMTQFGIGSTLANDSSLLKDGMTAVDLLSSWITLGPAYTGTILDEALKRFEFGVLFLNFIY